MAGAGEWSGVCARRAEEMQCLSPDSPRWSNSTQPQPDLTVGF
jgi:hypothetical protein